MAHWLALVVACVIALSTPPGAAAQAPTVDGVTIDPDAELVVALADDTNNMDPRIGMGSIRSNYIRQVFESLVDVDHAGKPVPGLALAWKPVNDLTWEFTLRRGVTFHDGEPFNADTVLFNLDRFFRRNLDKHGVKDVAAGTSFEKVYPFVTRWEKVDDHTVRIHTSEPAANLWDFIGREPLVPRAWTVKNGVEALNERPVGTGPWKLVEWKRKNHMLFERNERYWGAPPRVKRLRFVIIPEAAARIAALRAGQVASHRGGAAAGRRRAQARAHAARGVERAEAGLPHLSQRAHEGRVRVRRPRRRVRGSPRAAGAEPGGQPRGDRPEDLPRPGHRQRLARRDRRVRVRRAGGLSVRPGPRASRCWPRRPARTARRAWSCCFPPSTTARPSTRQCRRWSRC